jgi:Zn-dependent M28 family amino/carboxypeptidase
MTRRLLAFLGAAAALAAADFNGESALAFTRKAVSFGPRPPGSAAIGRMQTWIVQELKAMGWRVNEDAFTARTPRGPITMRNIVARLPGGSRRMIVLTGHVDTKQIPGVRFLGANDGGASTGFLLEMARVLPSRPRQDELVLVFFDGEEAFGEWSETDGIYGSRHLAERWAADGTAGRIRALINVDMIGDRDLGIVQEMNSSPALRNLVWTVAREMGYGKYFLNSQGYIEDDHMPFVRAGVPALNLIDFDYGPNNSWWHTAADTLDKLSPRSFQIVGDVLLETLRRLQQP